MAILFGGFGFIAIRAGVEGTIGPTWGTVTATRLAALPDVVPPVVAIAIGIGALFVAWWLARGYKRILDEDE